MGQDSITVTGLWLKLVRVGDWKPLSWFLAASAVLFVMSYLIQQIFTTPAAEQAADAKVRQLVPELVALSQKAPAIVFENFRSETAQVSSGGRVPIVFDYKDKRADCDPPDGQIANRGEYFFKVSALDPDGVYRLFWRLEPGQYSHEKPGSGEGKLWVDIPRLKPGLYAITMRAIFKCQGEAEVQIRDAGLAPFQVIPAPTVLSAP